ncbi:mechanosensitive ion channel family protein [bacterium]|nr:MAG: mechanosensitive ion channel family protein [bacterium]
MLMDKIYGFNRITEAIINFWNINEAWRFAAFMIIMAAGISLFEILFRFIKTSFREFILSKGYSPENWNLSLFKPSIRLAFIALVIRLTELVFILSHDQYKIIGIIEFILLAIAIILVFYEGISLLDRLRLLLPEDFRSQFPEETLLKLKRNLKISIFTAVFTGSLWFQKSLIPEPVSGHFLWPYLIALVAVYIIFVVAKQTDRFFSGIITSLKDSEGKKRFCIILKSTIWPLRLLFIALALLITVEILALPHSVEKIFERSEGILTTFAIVFFLYSLVDVAVYQITEYAGRKDTQLDLSFVQMFRIIARVLVIIFGAVYIIQVVFGKPMSTLLAGLGIGGLAVALAAQDTLKNFFGSIMIMLDKPFGIGQLVQVEDFKGTVEKIGFRSTRMRTVEGHLVTVPNEKIAASSIKNIANRPFIRRTSNITVTYDTPPGKVERAVSIIKEILADHEGMLPDYPPRVFFDEFNDVSLNILMTYWYSPPDYWEFKAFCEKVNLKIMRAFEAEGIEFAFPTTTTYLAQDNKRPLHINLSGGVNFNDSDKD